jgi:hypothetical protein
MMPPQLARSKRRHNRHSERRSLVELTPYINICDLIRWKAIPYQWDKSYFLEAPLKYPVKHLVISCETVEFHHHLEYVQTVLLRWCRTGFGRPRPLFVCQCGLGARRLFFRSGHFACRRCYGLAYASQKYDQLGRPRLQASKLRIIQLGGIPSIAKPLPAKPKWQRRRTYQRIRNEIQALEAQAKQTRFRKDIDARTFAYHIA